MAKKETGGKRAPKRSRAHSVSFSDARGEVTGFAHGWFFWVHQAFKDALDIRFVERIDPERTDALRERKSQEVSGLPLAELRRRKKESDELAEKFKEVMKASRKMVVETEGESPMYTFRATDSFESRCGKWQIQVSRESEEKIGGTGDNTKISHEVLGVTIYRRSDDPDAIWAKHSSATLWQPELAQLLKTGKAGTVDLTLDEANTEPSPQLQLI